jgi:hypothetical protein
VEEQIVASAQRQAERRKRINGEAAVGTMVEATVATLLILILALSCATT